MKNLILVVIILILTTSCENKEVAELNSRLSKLEIQNAKLTDSLNRIEYEKIMASALYGIPDNIKMVPNQANRFNFLFHSTENIHPYNVYRITKNGNEEVRELIYENHKKSIFEFDFVPETDKDKSFELLAVFDLDSIKVLIPGSIDMSLTE